MSFFFLFNDPAPTQIYTLSLHDALPISLAGPLPATANVHLSVSGSRRSRRKNPWSSRPVRPLPASRQAWKRRSEEHTSELQSLRHLVCRLLLEKKKKNKINTYDITISIV